jgi:hypothetical protein
MQAKPLGLIRSFIKNSCFGLQNMFLIGLKPFCEFYKIYETGLA